MKYAIEKIQIHSWNTLERYTGVIEYILEHFVLESVLVTFDCIEIYFSQGAGDDIRDVLLYEKKPPVFRGFWIRN